MLMIVDYSFLNANAPGIIVYGFKTFWIVKLIGNQHKLVLLAFKIDFTRISVHWRLLLAQADGTAEPYDGLNVELMRNSCVDDQYIWAFVPILWSGPKKTQT